MKGISSRLTLTDEVTLAVISQPTVIEPPNVTPISHSIFLNQRHLTRIAIFKYKFTLNIGVIVSFPSLSTCKQCKLKYSIIKTYYQRI